MNNKNSKFALSRLSYHVSQYYKCIFREKNINYEPKISFRDQLHLNCSRRVVERLIDIIVFYAVSAIFRPYNGGKSCCKREYMWSRVFVKENICDQTWTYICVLYKQWVNDMLLSTGWYNIWGYFLP